MLVRLKVLVGDRWRVRDVVEQASSGTWKPGRFARSRNTSYPRTYESL